MPRRNSSDAHLSINISITALILLLTFAETSCSPAGPQAAQNFHATFADQHSFATNACGPTALINSLRAGENTYQAAAASIPGDHDRNKIRHIILHYCSKKSRHLQNHRRWSIRGINSADLTDVYNEVHPNAYATFVHPASSSKPLLTHAVQLLATSLKKGLPPIVCVRRYVKGAPVNSHFITVIAVNAIQPSQPDHCTFTYIDPSGAKKSIGILSINPQFPKKLRAKIPQCQIAHDSIPSSEILLDAMILRR